MWPIPQTIFAAWLSLFLWLLLMDEMTAPTASSEPTPQPRAPTQANGSGVVQGQLVKIDGDSYIVKDAAGKDVSLRVGKNTVVDGRIKVGDKVDAQMGSDGTATIILKALP